MTNKKKQRTSNRTPRVPVKFNDHVVGNLGQKRYENGLEVIKEIIGNNGNEETGELGETSELKRKDRDIDNGVTGNESNVGNKVQNELNKDDNTSDKHESYGQRDNVNKIDVADCVKEKSAAYVSNSDKQPLMEEIWESENGDVLETDVEDISNKAKLSDYSTKKSYASATKSSGIYETNKLMFIPTEMNELGGEVVVFDEELVAIGTKKWELTLCGHLVGHYMSVAALRYHLRRMWNRYGLKEIVDNGNGNWLFKFSSEQGMNLVAEQSPWMVNSKPLMVYKWDPNVGMNKVEPKKLPIWVKLAEIPLEAWTVEGISAIGSSVGKPIIMDSMTAYVCENGVGRNEYARVLVEIDALKGFKETIELQYRDKDKNVKGTKTVKVWKC